MLDFKTATLIGMGKSNTELAKFLLSHGVSLKLCDENMPTLPPEISDSGNVEIHFGRNYLKNIGAEYIFVSPGIRRDIPEIECAAISGCRISSETELFFKYNPAKVIAVSGSDGKTTTVSMINHILRQNGDSVYLGGNIGTPPVSFLENLTPDDTVVLELSSFQLNFYSPICDCALLTNITQNHLNWHKNMDEYVRAKSNIYKNARIKCANADDPMVMSICENPDTVYSVKESISLLIGKYPYKTIVCADGQNVLMYKDGKTSVLYPVSAISSRMKYNVINAVAATATCIGRVQPKITEAAMRTFSGVSHRCEFLCDIDGAWVYDSSIDSTPSRTAATLDSFDDRCIVICGGRGKGLSQAPLTDALIKHARAVVFTGESGVQMMRCLTSSPGFDSHRMRIFLRPDFTDAVKCALTESRRGDNVILSPAATSFDAFSDYVQRSEKFRKTVFGYKRDNFSGRETHDTDGKRL